MKKHILSLFGVLLFMTSLIGQTSLEGTVTDQVDDEPILFGTVVLFKNEIMVSGTETDCDGYYLFSNIDPGIYDIEFSYVGYETKRIMRVVIKAGQKNKLDQKLKEGELLAVACIIEYKKPLISRDNTTQGRTITSEEIRSLPTKSINAIAAHSAGVSSKNNGNVSIRGSRSNQTVYYVDGIRIGNPNNESYGSIVENTYMDPVEDALSTFSIDVDRASYSNVRRFLDNGQIPPPDAVRIEEMINYFDYNYEQPKGDDPIALHSTLTDCPWNDAHQILHVGLQGMNIDTKDLPPSNLVFLIDVSGSMDNVNKLPLLKASFKLLINNLRPEDRVAIVTYAGYAGIALESTPATEKQKILNAIEGLGAGGSTAGAQGILTAYELAQNNFLKDGNNRIILATDGDFNVGISNNGGLEKLIEEKRDEGVFLSVLGFGTGNYKDDKMEILADKGNGNHAYIDNLQEARKVFINEFAGTLFTIAKDVKLQLEFNPGHVQAYRLIGYENRLLDKEDFNDDNKDAGELGAGHVVTALYEIVPVGSDSEYYNSVDDLKYQKNKVRPNVMHADELATIKFRYKQPDGEKSKRIVNTISPKSKLINECNESVRFSIAVAEFGMLLRESDYVHDGTYDDVISIAEDSKGNDEEGYRAEFVRLVKTVQELEVKYVQK